MHKSNGFQISYETHLSRELCFQLEKDYFKKIHFTKISWSDSYVFFTIVNKGPARIKSPGGQWPQIFQKFTPQIRKFTFYCIFILQF